MIDGVETLTLSSLGTHLVEVIVTAANDTITSPPTRSR